MQHLLRLLTGWAVVCDVWYLDPQTIRSGESTVDFTDRVKVTLTSEFKLIITENDCEESWIN